MKKIVLSLALGIGSALFVELMILAASHGQTDLIGQTLRIWFP